MFSFPGLVEKIHTATDTNYIISRIQISKDILFFAYFHVALTVCYIYMWNCVPTELCYPFYKYVYSYTEIIMFAKGMYIFIVSKIAGAYMCDA